MRPISNNPVTVTSDTSDSDLVAAVTGGNRQAFRLIVERYEGAVATTVISMLGNITEAEDIAQETMIQAYRALPSYKGEASFKTWLSRIAVNRSLDALRRKKRRFLWFLNKDDDDLLNDVPQQHCTNQQREQREAIQQSLLQLQPEFRAVAVLRLVQGYSTEEAADILQLPTGTVLSRLARAKKQLAAQLRERL
ncbi:RNA polymerase sigma factor [Spongorhabdus nitratireducens]